MSDSPGPSEAYLAVAQLIEARNHARRWCLINLAIALAGGLVSLVTYLAAASNPDGGTYGVFWGAVVFGGWYALRHGRNWWRCASLLHELGIRP